MNPLVSIIVPAYNAENFLQECLDSILSQTYSNLEVIVVDDGSDDRTPEILQRYKEKDHRVHLFRNEPNRGISFSRNLGIEKATGRYIAWLDSDDIALPNRIALQVDFLEKCPDYGLISSDLIIINEKSVEVGYRIYPHSEGAIRGAFTRLNPFAQPASMLRADLLKQIEGYDEDFECCEDYDLFLRVLMASKVANIDKALVKYRVSASQSKNCKLKLTIRNTLKVQKKALGAGMPDSALNALYRTALRVLLILPTPLVLWFFKKVYY